MPLNITIIGLDAIGAALGLALGTLDQEALPSGRPVITGWDADRRTVKEAVTRLIIDRQASDLAEAVREANLVVVSVPPGELAETFRTLGPLLKHGTIVTDVGSSKTEALQLARTLLPTTVDYISGHPLVSPAASGLDGARHELFKGAIYCLLPADNTHPNAVGTLADLVMAIGAKPYYIDPVEHDAYVAGVSQLPLLAATALMETLSRSGGWREMRPIAGVPLRTATTLVTADPAASAASAASNREAVERWLNELIRTLVELRDTLDQPEQLAAILSHARTAHEQWLEAAPNMRPGESDFFNRPEELERTHTLSSLFFGQRRKKPDKGR